MVEIRNELAQDNRVFFVTAKGYAADHLFGWLPKAFNMHPEIFALLAHEGSRPKYFKERTRGERPALVPFVEFLNDMSMTYEFIGDFYSYRAPDIGKLIKTQFPNIRAVNVIRHPIVWLNFYQQWRASNMRMGSGKANPLEWEWKVSAHSLFNALGLRMYDKENVDIWSFYQGLVQINHVLHETKGLENNYRAEDIADSPECYTEIFKYLTHDIVEVTPEYLDQVYSQRDVLYRGEKPENTDPEALIDSFEGWQVDAFRKIVKPESIDLFESFGYDFHGLPGPTVQMTRVESLSILDLFASTQQKSGTWLLSVILQELTLKRPFEPEPIQDPYSVDHVDIPQGHFFLWHQPITSDVASFIASRNARPIFLVRNIFSILKSIIRHFELDVDATINRSVGDNSMLGKMSMEKKISMFISGFASPELGWFGLDPICELADSYLKYAESGRPCLLLSYEEIIGNKKNAIERIAKFLGIPIDEGIIHRISILTSRERMAQQYGSHVRTASEGLEEITFTNDDIDAVQLLLNKYDLSDSRLRQFGVHSVAKRPEFVSRNAMA